MEQKDSVTALLKEELQLLNEMSGQMNGIRDTLQHNTSGKGVSEAVKRVEPLLARLFQVEKEQENFLKTAGYADMKASVDACDAQERPLANRFLQAVSALQHRMKKQVMSVQGLLRHSKEFIDFHVNVMNQTQANEVYAPPGGASVEAARGIKMFDANV